MLIREEPFVQPAKLPDWHAQMHDYALPACEKTLKRRFQEVKTEKKMKKNEKK